MICEIALDPQLVATWHDRKNYLFFEEKFGLRTRRIVTAYPKKWAAQVWAAFQQTSHAQDQNAKMRMDALLRHLKQNMIKRRSTFPDIQVWLDRAEAEHAARPFHAILSTDNPRETAEVIAADRLIENGRHPCWTVPDNPPVPRTAEELARAVAPILRACGHIVFIDPYFDPGHQRFMEPMAAFLNEIWANRYGIENPTVEIHTSIDRYFERYERGPNRDPAEENRAYSNLVDSFNRSLPRIIQENKTVKVTIWKEREASDELHNRYILTEVCGIKFGAGTDQSDDQPTKRTDDLNVMDPAQHAARWRQYVGSPGAFDLVGSSILINGTRRMR
jgi:hypothetical protein